MFVVEVRCGGFKKIKLEALRCQRPKRPRLAWRKKREGAVCKITKYDARVSCCDKGSSLKKLPEILLNANVFHSVSVTDELSHAKFSGGESNECEDSASPLL